MQQFPFLPLFIFIGVQMTFVANLVKDVRLQKEPVLKTTEAKYAYIGKLKRVHSQITNAQCKEPS